MITLTSPHTSNEVSLSTPAAPEDIEDAIYRVLGIDSPGELLQDRVFAAALLISNGEPVSLEGLQVTYA